MGRTQVSLHRNQLLKHVYFAFDGFSVQHKIHCEQTCFEKVYLTEEKEKTEETVSFAKRNLIASHAKNFSFDHYKIKNISWSSDITFQILNFKEVNWTKNQCFYYRKKWKKNIPQFVEWFMNFRIGKLKEKRWLNNRKKTVLRWALLWMKKKTCVHRVVNVKVAVIHGLFCFRAAESMDNRGFYSTVVNMWIHSTNPRNERKIILNFRQISLKESSLIEFTPSQARVQKKKNNKIHKHKWMMFWIYILTIYSDDAVCLAPGILRNALIHTVIVFLNITDG